MFSSTDHPECVPVFWPLPGRAFRIFGCKPGPLHHHHCAPYTMPQLHCHTHSLATCATYHTFN